MEANVYDLGNLPADQYKTIMKKPLLAAKYHEGNIVKLFYAGIPVFLCDFGEISADLVKHISKSLRDTSALAHVRSHIKKNAKIVK